MRALHLTSPYMKGPDVKRLQAKLGVGQDGEYGPLTRDAVRSRKYQMGFPKKALGTGASVFFQEVLFGERKAPRSYGVTARVRARYAEKHRNKVHDAVKILEDLEGTSEQPAGSNRGPGFIDNCQLGAGHGRFSVGEQGWPWCGCAVHEALKRAGIDMPGEMRSVRWIYNAARNGDHRLKLVPKEQARRGDILILFSPDTHTGFARAVPEGGQIKTVEANTSAGNSGSQSNGGCVAKRTRSMADVYAVARVVV